MFTCCAGVASLSAAAYATGDTAPLEVLGWFATVSDVGAGNLQCEEIGTRHVGPGDELLK